MGYQYPVHLDFIQFAKVYHKWDYQKLSPVTVIELVAESDFVNFDNIL